MATASDEVDAIGAFDAYEATRIQEDFPRRLVQMQRARARFFRNLSWVLLACTILFVFIGIFIFFRGDATKDLKAQEEVNLLKEMIEVDKQLDALSLQPATARERVHRLERAYVLVSCLDRMRTSLEAFRGEPTWEGLPGLTRVTKAHSTITSALLAPGQTPGGETVIDVKDFFPNDTSRFSTEVLEELRKRATELGMDIRQYNQKVAHLDEVIQNLSQQSAGQTGQLGSDILVEFGAAAQSLGSDLPSLDQLKQAIAHARQTSEVEAQKLAEGATAQEQSRQDLNRRRQQIKEQLDEFRLQREKIVFMAWLPDLTIRVGSVILLLFLTQVLLATYRYTLGLSSFYLARSDAIQMLQSDSAAPDRYLLADFKLLAETLSPESHRVDDVRGPVEQLADLVKAWIARPR